MRDNIKKILFIISIFYSLVVIVLMLVNSANVVTDIELYDTDENRVKLSEYKTQLSLLKQNDCTNVVNEMIEYYEQTSYNGKVNLKEMYNKNYGKSFLSFYMEVRNKCSLTDSFTKGNNLATKFLTEMMQREELYQRYVFQYEIKIKDNFMRNIADPDITRIEYKINKEVELEIISMLVDMLSKGGTINE